MLIAGDPSNTDAFKVLLSHLNHERCGNASMCVGAAQGALEHAVRYMNERVIGGRPLADLQGLQWKLADMAVQLEGARLLLARAVRLAGPGGTPPPLETALAKTAANLAAKFVCDEAMQIHGGYGYSREYPLERAYRDIRGLCFGAGTVEAQRNFIGLRVAAGRPDRVARLEGTAGLSRPARLLVVPHGLARVLHEGGGRAYYDGGVRLGTGGIRWGTSTQGSRGSGLRCASAPSCAPASRAPRRPGHCPRPRRGAASRRSPAGVKGQPGYLVYWDQNEEVDFLSMPKGTQGQLLPAWDLNGQVCVLPGGRFVGGYDPTLPSQHNLGGLKPYKQPPDGEELDEPNGSFSGQTLYVPGPYKLPGQSIGSDSPPSANGVFNNNQTYTGCAIDSHHNVFANDIATAQGNFPPPSSGRLVEWFAPNYTTDCIVYGPDAGGVGPHHTDGTGGLAQPGMMALAANGDLLVPNVGTSSVLRFAHSSLPTSAVPVSRAGCTRAPRSRCRRSSRPPSPPASPGTRRAAATRSAATSAIPSIVWVSASGQPEPGRGSVPGTTVADLGKSPDQYNPFGMAFAPDGTLYFIDIHIACTGPLTGCGPANYGGRVMRVTFANGQPSAPVTVAGGFDFPTSVTVCVPARTRCPYPSGKIKAPLSGPSENPAPDKGPASNAPATAGFG